jgi:hypothetical protein
MYGLKPVPFKLTHYRLIDCIGCVRFWLELELDRHINEVFTVASAPPVIVAVTNPLKKPVDYA